MLYTIGYARLTIICPRSTGQNIPEPTSQKSLIHAPTNCITHEIRSTVAVDIFLYIHIETKVIGTKVAVKIIPHMFTSSTGTL
jgi:hypothetical protein